MNKVGMEKERISLSVVDMDSAICRQKKMQANVNK